MSTYAAELLLAATRGAELRRDAAGARLAALARCCTPTAWVRVARRAAATATRVRDAVAAGRSTAPACCAA
jgi:hypothetical protein